MRCWSARCTSVPLLAGADGGSGKRCTYEKRNASGQLVNAPIELGERLRGIGQVTESTIPEGCDSEAERSVHSPRMKIDSGLMGSDLSEMAQRARALEDLGYDALLTAETSHDPFLPLPIAAEHT